MSIGEKVAAAVPDGVYEYVARHPRALYAVSVPLVVLAAVNLVRAVRLQVAVEQYVVAGQLAASEALGG